MLAAVHEDYQADDEGEAVSEPTIWWWTSDRMIERPDDEESGGFVHLPEVDRLRARLAQAEECIDGIARRAKHCTMAETEIHIIRRAIAAYRKAAQGG